MDAMLVRCGEVYKPKPGKRWVEERFKLNRLGDLMRALQKGKRESSGYWESV